MAKASRAPANPDKFEEASKFFRSRVVVTKDEWKLMTSEARRQAFTIAGTQQLKVVQTVFDELQKAIDKGTSPEAFRAALQKKLKDDFVAKNARTLDTAFINANQTAYMAGRWEQMSEVTDALPYWAFDAVLDNRTTVICSECNGVIRRHDDPWWLMHCPPLHHRCRSAIRALTAQMAKRRGISKEVPRPKIGEDWGVAPPLRRGQIWEPSNDNAHPVAKQEYKRKQANLQAANDNAKKAKPDDPKPALPRFKSADPSTRLGETGEKVFGRKLTDVEIDDLAGMRAKLPPGYTLSVETAEKKGVVSIRGIVHDGDKVAGNFHREYTSVDGKPVVNHSAFYLKDEYQKSGLGRALFNAQVDAYEAHGIAKVTLEAGDIGRYVWTKAGFEWTDPKQAADVISKLTKHLKKEVGPASAKKLMSSVKTPEDIARLVVGERRIGKEFLIDFGGLFDMAQTPGKIKRL